MNNEEFEEIFGNVPFENINKIKEWVNKNYVSKDKIREKIKEIENGTYDAKIVLKQLLKE